MSNVIKAYTVRYDDAAKMTLDTHLRIDKEIEEKRNVYQQSNEFQQNNGIHQESFVGGLKAVFVDALPSPQELQEKNTKVLEEVQKEAKQILEQAKKEAEQIKKEAHDLAQKKGYEDGVLQVQKEAKKLKAEYDEKSIQLQKEYEIMMEALEPQMVQLIAALVEKITGVIVQDKEEVIFYLIDRAIRNMDKSDEYTIKVSKEDYEYVSMRKNLLLGAIGREVTLLITEDANLAKNQCMIETDLKVINCSLDVQLNKLITDLKLIGGI